MHHGTKTDWLELCSSSVSRFHKLAPIAYQSRVYIALMSSADPAGPQQLPWFVTGPNETDYLLIGAGVFLVTATMLVGVLYLRLHHLPAHKAAGTGRVQLQLISVLTLLAMFTHNHAYWIAALLLALIPIPDFLSPLKRMSAALSQIANRRGTTPASAVRPASVQAPESSAGSEGTAARSLSA